MGSKTLIILLLVFFLALLAGTSLYLKTWLLVIFFAGVVLFAATLYWLAVKLITEEFNQSIL